MICVLLADKMVSIVDVVPEFQDTVAACVASLLVTKFAPVSVSVNAADPALTFVGLIDCSRGTGFGCTSGVIIKFTGFDNPLLPAPEKGLCVRIKAFPGVVTSDAGMVAYTCKTSPAESRISDVTSFPPFQVIYVCVTNPLPLIVSVKDGLPAAMFDGESVVAQVGEACRRGGDGKIPAEAAARIRAVSQVLNIAWIADALDSPASVICPRSGACPREPRCSVQPH